MERKKNILLIITGSIAAYKSLELIRLMTLNNLSVQVVMTKSAKEFITILSVQTLSGNKVHEDLFSLSDQSYIEHINLSRQADLIVVAPATANIIAKLANGFADDLASNILLAANRQILIAPAMNSFMWKNKALVRNVNLLIQDGVKFVKPISGKLACGEEGEGKMADPNTIYTEILKLIA